MNSIVKQGQSFLDKVTQLTGSWENALEAAILNNRSITDAPKIGEQFKMPPVTNRIVAEFFNENNEPATLTTKEQLQDIENIGIGKMAIGSTFIVS